MKRYLILPGFFVLAGILSSCAQLPVSDNNEVSQTAPEPQVAVNNRGIKEKNILYYLVAVKSDKSVWQIQSRGRIGGVNKLSFTEAQGLASNVSIGDWGYAWYVGLQAGALNYQSLWWLNGRSGRVNENISINGREIMAYDVGCGGNKITWAIGETTMYGSHFGANIYKNVNGAWAAVQGFGARIDVDKQMNAWICNATGMVWELVASSGGWISRGTPDAVDIAANYDDKTAKNSAYCVTSDGDVKKYAGGAAWNSTGFEKATHKKAARVDAQPESSGIAPLSVVTTDGCLYIYYPETNKAIKLNISDVTDASIFAKLK